MTVGASLRGPWRAVYVLGITEILSWGAIYYTPVLTVPLIAADRGWSIAFTMGGYSLGILVAGLASRYVGAFIDRHGGHRLMPFASLFGAAGLAALTQAASPTGYLLVWALLGVAMAGSLYDPAFATLGRIFGSAARRPITMLTLAGGFASTVSWPVTQFLLERVSWRGTYLCYAAVLALVAAPLHAFALPRIRAELEIVPKTEGGTSGPPPAPSASGRAFALIVAAFAIYAFVPSGLLAHLLSMFGRLGLEPSTAVAIGMLFGPCQVTARVFEFVFAREVHPLNVARLAVGLLLLGFASLLLLGLSAVTAAAFMITLGLCNGLITICRGTVPLALFGPQGYGRTVGRIAGPALVIQSAAPLVVAFVAERGSDPLALAVAGAFVIAALVCFLAVPRPQVTRRQR